jgi:GNAT superfamily N-acetyltransferase
VAALEVKPEYRGLGLGKALLDRLLEQADSGNISRVSIDLPAEFENFARVLSRAVFYPAVTRYCRET